MEERIEALDADRKRRHDVTDRLVEELEKRDKAVEEAVAMIVMLEAKVHQLVTERCMVQQVESAGLFSTRDFESSYGTVTPPGAESRVTKLDKVVNRMPSFLSERSENTEHLRTVYLGVRGSSALSLSRVAEGSVEPDCQGLASPTLSVLSESSFVSVYGQRSEGEALGQMAHALVDEPLILDGLDVCLSRPWPEDGPAPRRRAASVGRVAGIGKPPPRSSTAVPFQSMAGAIGHESPLQRIMRLDPAYANWKEAVGSQGPGGGGLEDSPPMATQTASRRRTKEEKREALRRVLTDGPGGARLHDQGLPPTPDTISTSTLHRFKTSNETLLQEQEQEPNGAAVQAGAQGARLSEPTSGAPLGDHVLFPHGSGEAGHGTKTDHRRPAAVRPQTAREPAAFRKGGNGWDSDSDDADARSLESSLDIWLRESAKPDNRGSQVSPDLFSFPANTTDGGWAAESLYGGPNNGQAEGSSIGQGQSHMQGLLALRHQLFPWTSGPQPPDRRSSLHAHTGSTLDGSATTAANEGGNSSAGARARHGKRQSEDTQKRADLRTPVQQPQAPPPLPGSEQKRYPPISGQQGARAGLNRLLRRSIGTSSSANTATEDAPSTAPSDVGGTADVTKNYHPMGVPSWVLRNGSAEDERTGVTPPPIVLNPRQGRRSVCEADRPASPPLPAEAPPATNVPDANMNAKVTPAQQHEGSGSSAVASSGPGSRRKWLPAFGRPNTSKNKTG